MSHLLGFMDVPYNWVRMMILQPRSHRWFSAGYGDMQAYRDLADSVFAEWSRDGLADFLSPLPDISWTAIDSGDADVCCDEGVFESPLSAALPEAAQLVRFLFVRAAHAGSLAPTRAVVVHYGATGTTQYEERDLKLARPLLHEGIASVILMPPYSGPRTPAGQTAHYVSTVAAYLRQSLAMVLEGTTILRRCLSARMSMHVPMDLSMHMLMHMTIPVHVLPIPAQALVLCICTFLNRACLLPPSGCQLGSRCATTSTSRQPSNSA